MMLMNKLRSLKRLLIPGAILIFLLTVMALSRTRYIQKRREPLPLAFKLYQDRPNPQVDTPASAQNTHHTDKC